MAFLQQRLNGRNYSENIIGRLLTFNYAGSWSVTSGTGSATIDNDLRFDGSGSLKLQNTSLTNNLSVTNANQSTVIKQSGAYQLSFYAYKNDALSKRDLTVNIFKNAVLLDTQNVVIGGATNDIDSEWVRVVSDKNYDLLKDDNITFTFTLLTEGKVIDLWIDGFMLCLNDRGNTMPPEYIKPIDKQIFGSYNYQDDGNSSVNLSVAGTYYKIVNNGLGALTTSAGGFDGITPYDTTTNEFVLSELDLYDDVEIRFDVKVTTNTTNQEVIFRLNIANGAAFIKLFSKEYDVAVTDLQEQFYVPVNVLTAAARTNGFFLEASSDKINAVIEVNGYYVKVNKRFV